jgi:hypothetical protein
MAIERFYSNVRTGLYSLGPRAAEIIGDAFPDRIRPQADSWLSAETVADYDRDEFEEILTPAELDRLSEAVRIFGSIADAAFRARGASEADQERAIEALKTIVEILETEKYSYADRFRIRRLLDQCLEEIRRRVDPRVESLRFRIETSYSDEGSDVDILVWATVSPDLYRDKPTYQAVASRIRGMVPEHLARHGVPHYVLVTMRTSEEQAQLAGHSF